jgi:hypothetical protein
MSRQFGIKGMEGFQAIMSNKTEDLLVISIKKCNIRDIQLII